MKLIYNLYDINNIKLQTLELQIKVAEGLDFGVVRERPMPPLAGVFCHRRPLSRRQRIASPLLPF